MPYKVVDEARLRLKPETGFGCLSARKTSLHLVLCTCVTPCKKTAETHEGSERGKDQSRVLLGLQAAEKPSQKVAAFPL